MKKGKPELPVDLGRLKAEFPELTDDDLDAYVTITRRVLGEPMARAKMMREVMANARRAQEKTAAGAKLAKDEELLVRYLAAVSKMQSSTIRH